MHGKVGWASETPELFCATWPTGRGGKRHLVVEALPEGGWDWLAWANDGSGRCLHGRAGSPDRAKEAAELGAMLMNLSPVVDLSEFRHLGLHSRARRPN